MASRSRTRGRRGHTAAHESEDLLQRRNLELTVKTHDVRAQIRDSLRNDGWKWVLAEVALLPYLAIKRGF